MEALHAHCAEHPFQRMLDFSCVLPVWWRKYNNTLRFIFMLLCKSENAEQQQKISGCNSSAVGNWKFKLAVQVPVMAKEDTSELFDSESVAKGQ